MAGGRRKNDRSSSGVPSWSPIFSSRSQGPEAPGHAATTRVRSRSDRARRSSGRGPASSQAGRERRAPAPPPEGRRPRRPARAPGALRRRDRDEPPRSNPWQNPIAARGGASSSEMSPERSWLLLHDEFDAAVSGLPNARVVGGAPLGGAQTR